MQKIKSIIILLCLVVFFYKALMFIVLETKNDYGTFQKLYGLNDEQKRELLLGDLYRFIRKCSQYIPENSNILLLTDNGNEGLYLSYHLFPRRIFFNNLQKIHEVPPPIDELDANWLNSKKIEWIIFRFSKKSNQNKIVELDGGKISKTIKIKNK